MHQTSYFPKVFRRFRLAFIGVAFVTLCVYLASATPWARWFGGRRDYSATIREGDALVTAIEAFRAECGLWPQYLEDATPRHAPEPEWFYDAEPLRQSGDETAGPLKVVRRRYEVSLATHVAGDPLRTHVGYDFDARSPGWRVWGGDDDRMLRAGAPAAMTSAALLPRETVIANELAEWDRRIAREGDAIEHWQGKVALLISLGRSAEARQAVAAAGAALPQSYWPRLALAALDMTEGGRAAKGGWPASAGDFVKWVGVHPSMTHHYYVSVLGRAVNDADRAAAAIASAIELPAVVAADDAQPTAYYFFDMARWALRAERWPLAIDVTRAWEKYEAGQKYPDASPAALRAAALLCQGQRAEAAAAFATVKGKPTRWLGNVQGAGGLAEAIARGDGTFRFDHGFPGANPEAFAVFEVPQ